MSDHPAGQQPAAAAAVECNTRPILRPTPLSRHCCACPPLPAPSYSCCSAPFASARQCASVAGGTAPSPDELACAGGAFVTRPHPRCCSSMLRASNCSASPTWPPQVARACELVRDGCITRRLQEPRSWARGRSRRCICLHVNANWIMLCFHLRHLVVLRRIQRAAACPTTLQFLVAERLFPGSAMRAVVQKVGGTAQRAAGVRCASQ